MPRTIVILVMLCLGPAAEVRAATCAQLATLVLPHTAVTAATDVAAGAFAPPSAAAQAPGPRMFGDLPAFCRVVATLTPSSDSDIKIEVWLPVQGWNGKFQAVGNGAWLGAIGYPAMAEALRRGYAASSTDTGHVGSSARFGLGHPEKVTDFAFRAVHEMTVTAKALVAAFYGGPAKFSYWVGCSAGGRQALKAAQMFPADFDGIVAGAPGLDWSGRSAQAVRIAHATQDPITQLTPAELQVLHAAVVTACDTHDGVRDGLLANPIACTFDPAALACTRTGDAPCLTPAQVATARLIYSPIVDGAASRQIPGLARGSELGWTGRGWSASARASGLEHLRYLVFADPAWDVPQFNLATDVARLQASASAAIDALDPNLTPFFARGGKLLQYHGWSDPQITPLASVDYYQRVAVASGGAAAIDASYRLFMAPGMAHCGGGDGPNEFDEVAALEAWVERGQAPQSIPAWLTRDGKRVRTRPLCPFPQVATYIGRGSIDEAENFVCR